MRRTVTQIVFTAVCLRVGCGVHSWFGTLFGTLAHVVIFVTIIVICPVFDSLEQKLQLYNSPIHIQDQLGRGYIRLSINLSIRLGIS